MNHRALRGLFYLLICSSDVAKLLQATEPSKSCHPLMAELIIYLSDKNSGQKKYKQQQTLKHTLLVKQEQNPIKIISN